MSVEESYLLACWVNRDSGIPDGTDLVKHVVRIGPNSKMPVVLEFASGGPLSHVACAPSCIDSRLIEAGITAPMSRIEQLAGTTLADGTGFPGCQRALSAYGIDSSETSDAPAGYIMNPMLNAVVDIGQFGAYYAARQGDVDALVMAGTAVPAPDPPTPEEDDTMFLATAGTRPSTEGQDPHGNGAIYLCTGSAAQPGNFKRWISGIEAAAVPEYEALYGAVVEDFNPFVLDRMLELPEITNDYVAFAPTSWVTRPLAVPDPAT